ncbi:hypothetical protein BGZ73_007676 [Actinomortierella ambigua]|nr:hypothetical protein BGZ73_007676 [Actinomortierella ambigua]
MYIYKALLLLAPAILVAARNLDGLQSKGLFLGIDTSDEKATGKNIYSQIQNHPMAAASIIQTVAKNTNFRPHEHGPQKSSDVFDTFYRDLFHLPGFRIKEEATCALVLSEDSDREKLLQELQNADLRDDVYRETIARAITGLVPNTSQDKKQVQDWTLLLALIKTAKHPDEQEPGTPASSGMSTPFFFGDYENGLDATGIVTVDFYTLSLSLEVDHDGKGDGRVKIKEQMAPLRLLRLVSDPQVLIDDAEGFSQRFKKATVSEFEKYFTTHQQQKHHTSWLNNEWIQAFSAATKQHFSKTFSLWL